MNQMKKISSYLFDKMGNFVNHFHHSRDHDLSIHVTTGDRKGAGTDANVRMVIYDENDVKSEVIKLNRQFHNDHERGSTCTFPASSAANFSRPSKIEIWRDSFGIGDSWFVDRIEIEDHNTSIRHLFPIHRWIPPERHVFITEYDCCLPQEDTDQEQRRKELQEKRRLYQFCVRFDGNPAQCRCLPEDEQFSHEYKWDIIKNKGILLLDTKKIKWTTDKWSSIADLKNVYKYTFGEPACLEYWNEDRWFGLQRVQGCNPVMIELCKEIPENFGVYSEMVEPFLEGFTLQTAIESKKLFIVNLKMLDGLPCRENRKLCAPIALFFLNKRSILLPIAIQLFQEKGPDNPVFLPSDPPYTWLLAKIYYNNADASYHQSVTHLGMTHLLMEGVVVCTHRNLSPSHPLFKLLAPHFLFLLAINSRGIDKLISPGGWVDKTMTVGITGMFELVKRTLNKWKLNVNGIIPNEIKSRGVDDPAILPYYPYRDDAIILYAATRRYVSEVVKHFYDDPDKIVHDYELHRWREEMVKERTLGGVGVQGLPGEQNGKFTDVEEIIETITVIISTCSLSHASANFMQYDEYGFPPNYAGILSDDIPTDKKPLTEKDIMVRLPNKMTTLDIMVITKLLSSRGTNSLGDFEVRYMYDECSSKAAEEFRKDLKNISLKVKERNRTQAFPYFWLDPEIVPNSISI